MSGETFSLVIGFLIISLFLLSLEILSKRQSIQKKSNKTPIHSKENKQNRHLVLRKLRSPKLF
jgi:hypothetical protein